MKVLIADDEIEIREVLRAVFEANKFEVLEYSDGEAALSNALLKKPDLIILDVMMPRISGWEACRELKKNEQTKNIPVIILTAKSRDIDELMTAEAGADLYIKKPFDPKDILEKAKALMAKGG
ncbi:MAG: response regulator transcription factor [Candidatus Margulisiibacteriota bacterium]|nr:response regulator transcription factor [Candidatus Margulisiibacteriota bacterium]